MENKKLKLPDKKYGKIYGNLPEFEEKLKETYEEIKTNKNQDYIIDISKIEFFDSKIVESILEFIKNYNLLKNSKPKFKFHPKMKDLAKLLRMNSFCDF